MPAGQVLLGGGGGGRKAGAEFTKAGVAAHRLLQTGVVRVGHAHLGGEIVRPLVVQFEDTEVVGGTLVVVVGQQLKVRVGGVQRPHTGLAGNHKAFVVDIGEGGTVTIGDVQIELRDQLVILLDDIAGNTKRIKAIDALRDLADLADLAVGDVQLARLQSGRHGIAGAFISDGEEQAILDDRAGDLRGVDLRFKCPDAQHAAGVVATQAV